MLCVDWKQHLFASIGFTISNKSFPFACQEQGNWWRFMPNLSSQFPSLSRGSSRIIIVRPYPYRNHKKIFQIRSGYQSHTLSATGR
jgi:hypothetical protein